MRPLSAGCHIISSRADAKIVLWIGSLRPRSLLSNLDAVVGPAVAPRYPHHDQMQRAWIHR
jgi:hypothetical protein